MTGKVLILGGYGNFGGRIAAALVRHGVPVIIAGRNGKKAEAMAASLHSSLATCAAFDAKRELTAQLQALKPTVAVNTCGPFQNSDYAIARECISQGVHYIDLADGRGFLGGITSLHTEAEKHGVSVISGASTVPGLSSAVLEHYRQEFSEIDAMVYGISPGQKSGRGLATTQGILTYVGKPLGSFAGAAKPVYGWQDVHRQAYPGLGMRWMANCDIPDLDLLPAHYSISSIRFYAGMELGILHLGLWMLSWPVRLGMPLRLPDHAEALLKISSWFDRFGTAHGGMHVILRGKDKDAQPHERRWFIIARDGDGPQIPCVPAIVLAKRLAGGEKLKPGAYPCMGLISLEAYLAEIEGLNISTLP